MAVQGTGLPLLYPGTPAVATTPGRWGERAGTLPKLEPAEIARRLDTTKWKLGNRRKILIRNLPQDSNSQDIHNLLQDYEIKYCYVDKIKKTAYVTLSDREQAEDAISRFHNHQLRDQEISVQLQPTDALLCVTNLPPLFTIKEFEELVRIYGHIERCFLVYSEFTGHSKGYGFVEYMKKDTASKARLGLVGKQLEDFTLFAQWVDASQLIEDFLHSKCLCVDKLPKDYNNTYELMQMFSFLHKPVYCQLAEEESGYSYGVAVVEYEKPEQAEEVRDAMDGTTVEGYTIQVSFSAPGSPGRNVLAALIAAQRRLQHNQKGLLPEPNPAQIMQSLNNPAMLQMLLQTQPPGMSGGHGSTDRSHYINPTVSQALSQLNKLHQKPSLAGNLLLQNYPHLQMAQQQLLQLKNQSNNSKPGLLGEAPGSMLQTAMGTAQTGSVEASQRDMQKNMLPYYHKQQLNSALSRLAQDKHLASVVFDSSLLAAQNPAQYQPSNPAQYQPSNPDAQNVYKSNNQMSLLGEPPRDVRLSTNPFLNLASVMPGNSLTGMAAPNYQQHAMDGLHSQDSTGQTGLDNYFTYNQNYGDYSQDALQQWYEQYSSYGSSQLDVQADSGQSSSTPGYGDYNAYIQAPPTYYANAQGTYQPGVSPSAEKGTSSDKRTYMVSNAESGYADQYSSASGENYSDSYFKRKKIY
ncbi:ribonucleoprotein PTB-binding 2 [Pseudophryne corroboree]|uniref:ribonucleoprotein PTB-binding 2 n=1 Tax=Pseudophryne corroboree TaxID=495146 RepID=UPI003081B2F8